MYAKNVPWFPWDERRKLEGICSMLFTPGKKCPIPDGCRAEISLQKDVEIQGRIAPTKIQLLFLYGGCEAIY